MRSSQLIALLLCTATAGFALQEPAPPAQNERPSLAEAARKAREKRADQPKAKQVFDNETVAKGTVSTPQASTPAADPQRSSERPAQKTSTAALEREYRARFAGLREQLRAAEGRAKVLTDEMAKYSPTSVTVEHYYYDPQRLKQLQSAIDTNNKRLADLKQRLADLEEELRRKGLPSGWAL